MQRVALLVASLVLAASTAPAAAGHASAPAAAGCDGVTVIVDYNELGGDTRVRCAGAGTAAESFDEAGFPLEFAPQVPDFVCRVTGMPEKGPCTDGDSYWSLWWTDGSEEWTYATLGVTALEVPAGGYLGFAWHQGEEDAAPPDFAVPGAGGATDADPVSSAPVEVVETDDGFPAWGFVGIAVLVLAVAAVPVLRRRRS